MPDAYGNFTAAELGYGAQQYTQWTGAAIPQQEYAAAVTAPATAATVAAGAAAPTMAYPTTAEELIAAVKEPITPPTVEIPPLPPQNTWPLGFYPRWDSGANLGLGAYVWEMLPPNVVSPDEVARLAQQQKELDESIRQFNQTQTYRYTELQQAATTGGLSQAEIELRLRQLQQDQVQFQAQQAQQQAQFGQQLGLSQEQLALQQQQQLWQQQQAATQLDWEQQQYAQPSAYQQAQLTMQQQQQTQSYELAQRQTALDEQEFAWQQQQYGTLSAYQQSQLDYGRAQLAQDQAQFAQTFGLTQQQAQWQQQQAATQLAWEKEQYGTLSAQQQAQQEYQTQNLALQTQIAEWQHQADIAAQQEQERAYMAQLAAKPINWLQYSAYTGQQPVVQPWMQPLMPQEYASFGAGQPIPGYTSASMTGMPTLTTPSRQYQARIGPTSLAQYQGYQQAQTGAMPEETQWRLWNQAPPGGQATQLTYGR